MRGVAAAQRLRRVERRVVAQRDERVLQRRARVRVRVDVARRHRRHPQPLGQPGEPAVARAVVALERPLQLDAQVVAPERGEQPPQRRLVVHALARAAAQADEPGGVLLERLQRHRRRRLAVVARVRVRARDDVAEVAPARLRVDQQRQVAAVVEVDLRAVDRLQPEPLGGLGELHRAAQPVVVGQREGAVAEPGGRTGQLLRQRGAVEEGEGGVGVQLGVPPAAPTAASAGTTSGTAAAALRSGSGMTSAPRRPARRAAAVAYVDVERAAGDRQLLQPALREQQRLGAHGQPVALVDGRRDDQVDRAELVLEQDEDDPLGGARAAGGRRPGRRSSPACRARASRGRAW